MSDFDDLMKIVISGVKNAKPPRGSMPMARWQCVAEVFGISAVEATRLCRPAGVDAYEQLQPEYCDGCHFDGESDQELRECPKSLNAGYHSTDWQNKEGPCCWCGEGVPDNGAMWWPESFTKPAGETS